MKNEFILISGRAGAGKTELVLLYCNQYPETTLLIGEEYSAEYIRQRGLDRHVAIVRHDKFNEVDLSKYKTICIDYVELLDEVDLRNIVKKSSEMNLRIIALTQMRRGDFNINNIFQSILVGASQ